MTYEERVLSEVFPEYGDYMARTARLLPGVYQDPILVNRPYRI